MTQVPSHGGTPLPATNMVEMMAKYMDQPIRGVVKYQERIVDALHIPPGSRVADLGAGTGVYTEPLAIAVTKGGAKGRVTALDVSPFFLQRVQERKERLKASDVAAADAIECRQIGQSDVGSIDDGSVDVMLIVDTFHHLPDAAATSRAVFRALAANGRFVIIESDRDKLMAEMARSTPQEFAQLSQHAHGGGGHDHAHQHGHGGHHSHENSGVSPHNHSRDHSAGNGDRPTLNRIPAVAVSAITATLVAAGLQLHSDLKNSINIDDIDCFLVFIKPA